MMFGETTGMERGTERVQGQNGWLFEWGGGEKESTKRSFEQNWKGGGKKRGMNKITPSPKRRVGFQGGGHALSTPGR